MIFLLHLLSHASADTDTHGKERQLLAFLSHSLFGLTAFSASDSACETPATANRTTTTAGVARHAAAVGVCLVHGTVFLS